tara:strand:- start:1811 stop:1969 length:159 start_codon:yes stop_codon:yes gene_type:complete
MKVVIAKWKNEGYVLVAQSSNEKFLQRKKRENEHLNSKIVSVEEWQLIQACQ